MALVLYSVLRRHMKPTGRYFEPRADLPAPPVMGLPSGETVLGWYENPEPWQESLLIFTDNAIYSINGSEIVRIGIDEIVGYDMPSKTTDVTGVRVRTRDGFRFLRIAGSHRAKGKTKDALERIPVTDGTPLADVNFADVFSLVQVLFVLGKKT